MDDFVKNFFFILAILSASGSVMQGRPMTVEKCGVIQQSMARILGGEEAEHGDNPWMVTIHENIYGDFDHICGGAILNEHWIITAAHCMEDPKEPWKYEIHVGLHTLSKKNRMHAKKYKISKVIVHEEYNTGTAMLNDIALLRTKLPIDFKDSSGFVNGICLPETAIDPKGNATVIGWGRTLQSGKISDVLKTVEVPIVPREQCNEAYDKENPNDDTDQYVFDTQICAGLPNKDSCQGDSGGPMIQRNETGVHTLIGVVSYGTGCGTRDYPGIYTKVAAYMDWLDEKMKD